MQFDDLFTHIGAFGTYQKIKYFLVCVAYCLPAICVYNFTFMTGKVPHRCKINENDTYEIATYENFWDTVMEIPIERKRGDTWSSCLRRTTSIDLAKPLMDGYNLSLHDQLHDKMISEKKKLEYMKMIDEKDLNSTNDKCDEWVYDHSTFTSTLTEEWDLVCDRLTFKSSAQTAYFFGILIGSFILGVLSDKWGRRPVMLLSFILMLIASLGCTFFPQKLFGFWPSYLLFVISRVVLAVSTRGISVSGFILGMEIVGIQARTHAGIIVEYFFAIGQLVLVLLAYFIRDWRTLGWATSLVVVPFLSYYWVLPESPRWLLSSGKDDEAKKIMKRIAKSNNRPWNEYNWTKVVRHEFGQVSTESLKNGGDGKGEIQILFDEEGGQPKLKRTKKESSLSNDIIQLMKQPSLRLVTINLFWNWIVNNMLFYGLGLNVRNLAGNIYLNFTISAIMEIISLSITHVLLDRLGRKRLLSAFLMLAGVSCMSTIFFNNNIAVIVCAMIGKFAASSSYGIIYLYSSELFPTHVRNSAMGLCSMMARIGSMLAPQFVILGEKVWAPLPLIIFGAFGLSAGIMSLMLPETLGEPLPQTIEDGVILANKGWYFCCGRCMKDTPMRKKDEMRNGTEMDGLMTENGDVVKT
ncbi:hypothetical protein SNEBB_002699 [Seison nebaliae]|nr:hypothetical protein SNEBB_002699 [Seison nebaliae]